MLMDWMDGWIPMLMEADYRDGSDSKTEIIGVILIQ
jgi:hypothetical protein